MNELCGVTTEALGVNHTDAVICAKGALILNIHF